MLKLGLFGLDIRLFIITIDINESETVPLVGMRLLRGYDLRIQAIEAGAVTIEALPL